MGSGIHPRLKGLLAQQSKSPTIPVDQLTPARVRADEVMVLELQTPAVHLHAITEDMKVQAYVFVDTTHPGPNELQRS